jgi:cytochrome c-type biogenesis protein CcmE
MNRKVTSLVGAIVALILAGIAIWAFLGSMVPYTHIFSEAKSGRNIQVYGKIDHSSIMENDFVIQDESGQTMKIHSPKPLPSNLSQAQYCVVSGVWTSQKDWFEAGSVLVKCPSKYEEESNP